MSVSVPIFGASTNLSPVSGTSFVGERRHTESLPVCDVEHPTTGGVQRANQIAFVAMKHVKSKQRVADHGEVFTPAWLVEAMLDLVKDETRAD